MPPLVPPQQTKCGLGIRDHAVPDPFERIRELHLESLQMLPHVELYAHVLEVPRAVEMDHLGGISDRRVEGRDLPPLPRLEPALLDQLALRGGERLLAALQLPR